MEYRKIVFIFEIKYKTAYLAMVIRACFFSPTYRPIHVCDQSIRKGDGLEL